MQKNSKNSYSKLSISLNSKGRLFNEKKVNYEVHIKGTEIELFILQLLEGLSTRPKFLLILLETITEQE